MKEPRYILVSDYRCNGYELIDTKTERVIEIYGPGELIRAMQDRNGYNAEEEREQGGDFDTLEEKRGER